MKKIWPMINSFFVAVLRRKSNVSTKIPPEQLPQEVLQAVMAEASMLKQHHDVSVRALEVGEVPTLPKKADD